jgi:hypothetical protein
MMRHFFFMSKRPLRPGRNITVKAVFYCKDCQGDFLEHSPYLLSHGCRSLLKKPDYTESV